MRNKRRIIMAFFGLAFAGSAAAGVLTSMRDEAVADSERPPRFDKLLSLVPAYPNAYFYPMGERLMTEGVEREMGYALTSDPPRKVADRYESIWHTQGFTVDRNAFEDGEVVTATALGDNWARTIVATGTGEGTTIVASVREVLQVPQAPKLPVPSSCKVASQSGALDEGVSTEIVFLGCTGFVSEIVEYYDGVMHGKERIEPLAGDEPSGSMHVIYSGRGLNVTVTAMQSPLEEDEIPRCTASITWQEQR